MHVPWVQVGSQVRQCVVRICVLVACHFRWGQGCGIPLPVRAGVRARVACAPPRSLSTAVPLCLAGTNAVPRTESHTLGQSPRALCRCPSACATCRACVVHSPPGSLVGFVPATVVCRAPWHVPPPHCPHPARDALRPRPCTLCPRVCGCDWRASFYRGVRPAFPLPSARRHCRPTDRAGGSLPPLRPADNTLSFLLLHRAPLPPTGVTPSDAHVSTCPRGEAVRALQSGTEGRRRGAGTSSKGKWR